MTNVQDKELIDPRFHMNIFESNGTNWNHVCFFPNWESFSLQATYMNESIYVSSIKHYITSDFFRANLHVIVCGEVIKPTTSESHTT